MPEMCITGYSLGDRLFMPGTLKRAWSMLELLSHKVKGCLAIVGFPMQYQDALYNATAVIGNGRIWGIVPKRISPLEMSNTRVDGMPRGSVLGLKPLLLRMVKRYRWWLGL